MWNLSLSCLSIGGYKQLFLGGPWMDSRLTLSILDSTKHWLHCFWKITALCPHELSAYEAILIISSLFMDKLTANDKKKYNPL